MVKVVRDVEKVRGARDEGSRVELGPGRKAGSGQTTMAFHGVGLMCEHARRGLKKRLCWCSRCFAIITLQLKICSTVGPTLSSSEACSTLLGWLVKPMVLRSYRASN